jgi:hypothetical protein
VKHGESGGTIPGTATDNPPLWEAAKARSDFQCEIFKVRDGRIRSADTIGGVVAAAAATIATLAAGVLNQAGRSQWIIYVMLLGVVTVVIVVVARREAPLRIRKTKTTMDKAAEAVKAVQNADIFGSSIVLYQKCFEAWLAVTTSAETREKQKRHLDAVAVLMLAVETSVAAFGMVS